MYRRFCALSALLVTLMFGTGCGGGGGNVIPPPPALPAPTVPPAPASVLREVFSVEEYPHPVAGMRYSKFVPAFVGYMNFPRNARLSYPTGYVSYDNSREDQVIMEWDNALGAFHNYQSPSLATRGGLFAPFPVLATTISPSGWSWGGVGGNSESGYVTSEATIWKGAPTDPGTVVETIRVKDMAPAGWTYLYVLGVGYQGQLLMLAQRGDEKNKFYVGILVPEYNVTP